MSTNWIRFILFRRHFWFQVIPYTYFAHKKARLILIGEAAVENRPVQARAALCNQLQNEIVMS